MYIIKSWKSSLTLLKWGNLKSFLSTILDALPGIYISWIRRSWWAFIFVVAIIWAFVVVKHLDYAPLILIIGLSLLFSYLYTMLFVTVKQEIAKRHDYKKHFIYIGIILAGALFLVWYWIPYSFIVSLITKPAGYINTLIAKAIEKGKILPSKVYESQGLPHVFLIVYLLFSWPSLIALLFLFWFFIFLDKRPVISNLLISLVNALKFILYNMPLLIIVHAALLIIAFLTGLLFDAIMSLLPENIIMIGFIVRAIIVFLLIEPVVITLYGQLYEKRSREQSTLYH